MGWIKDWLKGRFLDWAIPAVISFLRTQLDKYVDDPNTDADDEFKAATLEFIEYSLDKRFR